jgi:large subunit ribosomal protein L17
MRHRRHVKRLNRDTNHRKMLFRNLVRSLVESGEIVTTEVKAKETQRIADKLIGKAKTDSLATRRTLHQFFGRRDVVNTLVDTVAPVFATRVSGFTRITTVGTRRGDNTKVVTLSLVEKPAKLGTLKKAATEKVATAGQKEAKVSDETKATKKAAPKKTAAPVAKKIAATIATKATATKTRQKTTQKKAK